MSDMNRISDSTVEKQSRPVITFVIAAMVVTAMSLSAWVLFHDSAKNRNSFNGATIKVNMTQTEKEYLSKLFVKDIKLSRAENFLHQEVTILSGTIMNSGTQTVTKLDLTIQFSDPMDQVALRETRGVLGEPPVGIGPGQERAFEISFDHVPATWNMQQPTLRVAVITVR
ncbi:MAG: hypothetical protein WAK20_13545 [Candidatus Acidiferrum sp.]